VDSNSETSVSPYFEYEDERAHVVAEGDHALLDQRTQLVNPIRPSLRRFGLKFSYWPACSEANLVLISPRSDSRSGAVPAVDRGEDELELNWKIANGRASSMSRRYFVANGLRYMWVLTFRDSQLDRRWVMKSVSELARRIRSVRGRATFPYWYSPELHPNGHGWHVNLFLPFRFDHSEMEELWGYGFVWVTDFAIARRGPHGEPLGLSRTPQEALRRAARYGCKYSQKDWSPEHVGPRNHRYEIAQGFRPEVVTKWVQDPFEAEELVAEYVPEDHWHDLYRWNSNDDPEWTRVPVRTWRW
jgi:hypothetical protein